MSRLRARLLALLERKQHPSWQRFSDGVVDRAGLLLHYQHEWEIVVRDFPVLLARLYAQAPATVLRERLAEEIYEEQCGALSGSGPHTALFLRTMRALGFADDDFARVSLSPAGRAYRQLLDESSAGPVLVGFAVLAIFVEGSAHEGRALEHELDEDAVEARLRAHPLVRHYGVPPSEMEAARVHIRGERRRRQIAWQLLLDQARAADEEPIVDGCARALALWTDYRAAIGAAWGWR